MKPCQIARLYWRHGGPSTACTAVSKIGPIVSAGNDTDDEARHHQKLDREAHPARGLLRRLRQLLRRRPEENVMDETQRVGDA